MLHNCFIEQPVVIYFLTLVPTISLYNVLYSYYKQGNLIHVWCAVKYNNTLSTNDFLFQLLINIDNKAAYVQEYLGWTMVYTSKQAISTHNIMVHNIITGRVLLSNHCWTYSPSYTTYWSCLVYNCTMYLCSCTKEAILFASHYTSSESVWWTQRYLPKPIEKSNWR